LEDSAFSSLRRSLPASGHGSRSSRSVVDVFDRTENASWVSALLVVEFLPSVIVGFLAGRLLDIAPRRWILVIADLARAAVFFILPLATSPLQIVALAFVAGMATSLFRPAVYAGLPNLVSDEDLPQANGLLQTADNSRGRSARSWAGRSSRRRARMPPTW
jgi:MFS family permease